MRSFWDINEALKCVQEGETHMNKLRKPEAVRALLALAWFVRSIPGAPELLQEVRALAGRVTDGLDKPGTADYVDHPWRALMAQKGLTPYSYTAYLKTSGVPQAPPPLPGHVPAWSYVPDSTDGAAARVQAAAAHQETQGEDTIFSGLGTLTQQGAGTADGGDMGDTAEEEDGNDDAADGQGKVSAPNTHDDPVRVGVVDDSVVAPHTGAGGTGNVRTPAATDPLVADGSTVGRTGAGQSQDQAGAQVRGPADNNNRKKLCKSVWRDDVCRDRDCDRAHPPRCGDPGCFPVRRRDCQHWHRLGGIQRRQQQRQQSQQSQQHQGNGCGVGPGRAGRQQTQGMRQQQQQLHRRAQQDGRRQQGQLQQQQRGSAVPKLKQKGTGPNGPNNRGGSSGSGGRSNSNSFSNNHLLHERLVAMERRLEGLRGKSESGALSYRDVAARGLLPNSSSSNNTSNHMGGPGPIASARGSAPAPPDAAVLGTVVAAVMAVLSRGQHS